MTSYLGVMFFKEYALVRPLIIRPLEDLEFQKYQIARTELYGFAKKQELFRLVSANYIEYKDVLNRYSKTHYETSDMDGSHLEEVVFNINRLVLNFLSAIRSFLDHAETNIKRTYGKESDKLKLFTKVRTSCYDTYFSYRFLYKLRNYSQHIGMPITGLDASHKMVNINPLKYDHVLKTVTFKTDLLKFDDWGVYSKYDNYGKCREIRIRDEISLLPEKIDINPYIDEMMYCIEKINSTFYGKEEFIKLLQHTAFLDKLVKEASISGSIPCVISKMERSTNRDKFLEEFYFTYEKFPLNAMELIDVLNIRSSGNPWNK